MTQTTFAQIARARAAHVAPLSAIDAVLALLGASAQKPPEALDRDRKLQMVGRFVRAIPGLGVHASSQLEHEILEAVGVTSGARYVIALQNAISLISVRNHLHALAATVGMSWSDGMLLQSAIADVARQVLEHGGGTLEMTATDDHCVSVSVHSSTRLGAVTATPNHATPVWLAGALNLAKYFRSEAIGAGNHLEFSFDMPRVVGA